MRRDNSHTIKTQMRKRTLSLNSTQNEEEKVRPLSVRPSRRPSRRRKKDTQKQIGNGSNMVNLMKIHLMKYDVYVSHVC